MLPPPRLCIGPSGWASPQSRRMHPLVNLSTRFGVVEIESSFRRPLRAEVSRLWLSKVSQNPGFVFTALLWRRFTHERSLETSEITRFKDGLWPLERAGRLGCLVMQFPWAFRFTVENREFLIQLRRAFHEFPMAVEMRHRSWLAEEALGTLIDYRLGFVNIDQPEHASAMPPSALVTSGVAYVRLHGRERDYWRREFASRPGLSGYQYSPVELGQWTERIEHVRKHANTTFVIAGGPVSNALQLASLLGGQADTQMLSHATAA